MRVTVLGAGIMGLATAWALTKRGHAVTLVEQGAIPNPLSASGDEHRMIRRAYGGADGYARTITEAFEAWDEMWHDLGARHAADCGVLGVSQAAGDDAERFREGLDCTGYPYRLFEAPEAARRYPFLDAATFRYAYLSPEGGALFCQRIAGDLARWLIEHGATVRQNARVEAVDLDRAAARLASGETIAADRLVVAAGAWTLRLVPDLAEVLTLYRTAVAYMVPPSDLKPVWEAAPALLDIGGTVGGWALPPAQGTGLKFGAEVHKRPAPGPDWKRASEPGEGERLRGYFAPPLARIGEYGVDRVVTCAYVFTADHKFLARSYGDSLVISACSGHGYKFGAGIGRRVAAALDTGALDDLAAWMRAEAVAA